MLDSDEKNWRDTDPATSAKAGGTNSKRKAAELGLLITFVEPWRRYQRGEVDLAHAGLNVAEAMKAAGYGEREGYRRRYSTLISKGEIIPIRVNGVIVERVGWHPPYTQQVCAISDAGLERLARYGYA